MPPRRTLLSGTTFAIPALSSRPIPAKIMHEEFAQCYTSGPCVFVMCHATVFLQDHVATKRHGTVQVHKSICPNIRQHEVQVPNVTAQGWLYTT